MTWWTSAKAGSQDVIDAVLEFAGKTIDDIEDSTQEQAEAMRDFVIVQREQADAHVQQYESLAEQNADVAETLTSMAIEGQQGNAAAMSELARVLEAFYTFNGAPAVEDLVPVYRNMLIAQQRVAQEMG